MQAKPKAKDFGDGGEDSQLPPLTPPGKVWKTTHPLASETIMKDDSLKREATDGAGPGSPLTLEEWRATINTLKQAAQLMREAVNTVARKISADAGLDPQLLGIHPHNAMCAYNAGQPWENVDYNRVKAVMDLLAHEFDAFRMVDAFDKATRLDPHDRWLEANREPEAAA